MKFYTVCYHEENELFTDIEAESGEEALRIFENMIMAGEINFSEMELVDSNVSIVYEDSAEYKDPTFDSVIAAYESFIDEHYDLDLCRDNFYMSDDVLRRIVTAKARSSDDKFDLIRGLLIDNFIGDVIMDRAISESGLSEREKEILDDNWDEFQSWAFDLGVTVNTDELNAYIAQFMMRLVSDEV